MFSKFIYESKKHIGDRNEQQDDLIILESKDKKRILLVLADGMGGHRGGKQASRSVILAAKDVWQQSAEGTRYSPEGMLEFTITLAFKKMKANGEQANISPRSTCVILFIKDDIAYYCHFGDSRLYHFRKGQLLRRTKDHSVVQMLIDMGQLAEKDMGTHEDQGRLLKWIGGEKAPQEIVVEIAEIRKRDHFLLCSDGLWEYVKLAEMERLLQSKVELNLIVNSMLKTARQKAPGKGDNISLIILETKSGKWVKNWQLLGLGLILLFSSFVGFAYYFFTDSCESFDNANIIVEPQNPVPNQIIKEKKSR